MDEIEKMKLEILAMLGDDEMDPRDRIDAVVEYLESK